MTLNIGDIVENKYRITRLIGEGGMGSVYEGENTRIQRRVAIKVLHAAVAENEELAQRFEREAQAAGRIGNDHILEILDMGVLPDGDRFMVMELLDGDPLSTRIQIRGRLPAIEVAQLGKQIVEGLAAAHRAGIIHRDLKPDNIFILREKAGNRDFVKIIDFGISKFQSLGDEMKMTRTGTVMGTPYYMSPEQASGAAEADARTDLYAVGVMLYEALTGDVPFNATTFNQLMFQIVLAEPAHPLERVPDLDPAFASIVVKAMAREREQRFQTAEEFAQALGAWLQTGAGVVAPPRDPTPPAERTLPPGFAEGIGMAPAQLGVTGSTNGNWAAAPAAVPPPKKSSALPVLLGVAGGGLVLLLVVTVIVVRSIGGKSAEAEPAAPGESAAQVDTPPEPTESQAATPPEPPPSESAEPPTGDSAQPESSATPDKTAAVKPPPPVRTGGGNVKPPPPDPPPVKTGGGTDFGY